jgi:hypothetical protein
MTEFMVFAKGVGVIRYFYAYESPRQPATQYYQARLARFRVK